jgi:hypothetical protein
VNGLRIELAVAFREPFAGKDGVLCLPGVSSPWKADREPEALSDYVAR